MVSRNRPSIREPPCTRQSLHKAVRPINAAAAARKDKVGRQEMSRTARLSPAVTVVGGGKTARTRGAIEEHTRSTRGAHEELTRNSRGTLERASQASGCQRPCATLAPRALPGIRANLPPVPGLFTGQFLRCTNVTWVCRIPSADGRRPRAVGKGHILALPPPIAFGTRSERGCPQPQQPHLRNGSPMFRDATPCGRGAAEDSRAPVAVSGCARWKGPLPFPLGNAHSA